MCEALKLQDVLQSPLPALTRSLITIRSSPLARYKDQVLRTSPVSPSLRSAMMYLAVWCALFFPAALAQTQYEMVKEYIGERFFDEWNFYDARACASLSPLIAFIAHQIALS